MTGAASGVAPDGPSPLESALSEAATRLASRRPALMVLSAGDPGPLAWFAEVWPDRSITIGPPRTRMDAAIGVARSDGRALVVLSEAEAAELQPAAGCVVIATGPGLLGAAYRRHMAVCQPSRPGDVEPLLDGAVDHRDGVLLWLPHRWVSGTGPGAAVFGEHRTFTRGARGLLLGAGATAGAAARIGRLLAGRDMPVTALEAATVLPATGVDASLLVDHLLVGPLSTPRASALTAVAVTAEEEATVRSVMAALG